MDEVMDFLKNVSNEFGIRKGMTESIDNWRGRLVYSYLGQVGYSAIFDTIEEEDCSSIIHLKRRVADALTSVFSLYPKMKELFPDPSDNLEEEIYSVLLSGGYLYHEPNRIAPPIRRIAQGDKIQFARGLSLEEKKNISGLGFFLAGGQDHSEMHCSIETMFDLSTDSLDEFWTRLINDAVFSRVHQDVRLEYLRTSPPYTVGEWEQNPETTGGISVARTVGEGSALYFLYRFQNGEMELCPLPNWMTTERGYRDVTVSCLASRKVLPSSTFRVDNSIVILRIGYLFPPKELNMIKLYSWPESYKDLRKNYVRIFSTEVFNEIRKVLEAKGYLFAQEG